MPTVAALKEYDARVDAKKRVRIRGAAARYFRVAHYANGTILLRPRVLKQPPLPAAVVRCIGKSLANMRAGKRSDPVDLKKLAAMKV